MNSHTSLKWGTGTRAVVGTGVPHCGITLAPTTVRRALLFCGETERAGTPRDSHPKPRAKWLFLPFQSCLLDTLNPRAELAQFRVHAFIAAIQMVDTIYLRRAFGRQPRNHQSR
jgi:hypothetical protein